MTDTDCICGHPWQSHGPCDCRPNCSDHLGPCDWCGCRTDAV